MIKLGDIKNLNDSTFRNMLDIIARTDARRVRGLENSHTFNRPFEEQDGENTHRLLLWIDKNTTGKFLLSQYTVGFVDEKDAVIYRLRFGK